MKYICFVLYLQICFKECTIDINIKELNYIADHLTPTECRRLFASLYFTTKGLPAALFEAARQVPTNIPCIKLLTKWNSGAEKWEGKGNTHAFVERRLRQIGKTSLADWLGKMVFHQLAKEVNRSLEDEPLVIKEKPGITVKVFKDGDLKFDEEQWTTLDSLLSASMFCLLFFTLAAFCRMLKLTFRKARMKRKNAKNAEELVDLMSAESVESDQETVYELDMENRKRSRLSFECDVKKTTSESDK